MAVCSSLCCKRYPMFVLVCVFSTSVYVCVCVLKQTQWYDVNPLRAGDTHQKLSKAKIFLKAYHTQLMYM